MASTLFIWMFKKKSFSVFKKPLKSVLKLSHNSTYLFLLLPWGHLKHRKNVQIKKNCNREKIKLFEANQIYAGLKITSIFFNFFSLPVLFLQLS